MTSPGKKIRTTKDISSAARGRRLSLGLSQTELADRSNVSRQWVSNFESGKPTAEFGLILKLMDALDLELAISTRDEALASERDLDGILDRFRR